VVAAAVALTLEVPGSAEHPRGWWTVDAEGPLLGAQVVLATDARTPPTTEAARAVVDATAVGRHLTIRSWRPGDRVQPLGLSGRKKLQDVFVDRKVPRDERDRVPIVLDASGRIVWVAGHVVGEPFRVTSHSEAVVVLTLRH
jgi:tRNA(Ile)-lysidine synthase